MISITFTIQLCFIQGMYTRGHDLGPSLVKPITSLRSGSLCLFKVLLQLPLQPHSVYFLWERFRPDILVPAQGLLGSFDFIFSLEVFFSSGEAAVGLWCLRDIIIIGWSAYQPLLQQSLPPERVVMKAFPLMYCRGESYVKTCTDTDIVPSCDFTAKWSSHARKVLIFSGGN